MDVAPSLLLVCFTAVSSLPQAGGVRPAVPPPPLPGQRRLGAGLPPLRGQDHAAVSAATEGRQVAHLTLLPH